MLLEWSACTIVTSVTWGLSATTQPPYHLLGSDAAFRKAIVFLVTPAQSARAGGSDRQFPQMLLIQFLQR